MKKYVVLAILFAAGCSTGNSNNNQPRPAPASDAEVQAANQKSLRCLAQYSEDLDDGISDVNTVARAVSNSCRSERNEFYIVSTRGRGPLNQNAVMNAIVEKDIEAATFYILSNRANRRQQ